MSDHKAQATGLRVVGASAGTGKTYRLTQEIEHAVTTEGEGGIRADQLVAVTYTRRAQVELESRVRQRLLASTAADRAAWLPQAYLGTVHAVCLRWVRELAIDAGMSPHVEVLADEELSLATVLEETVPAEMRDELDELAGRLQIRLSTIEGQVYWNQPVQDVIALARGGRIAPDALPAMAEQSWRGYLALMPRSVADGAALDRALATALDRALETIDTTSDTTAKTRATVEVLREARRSVDNERATWMLWNKLCGLDAGAKSDDALGRVRLAAAAWSQHPQLHSDIRRFTELVYAAAALTLERYAHWKRQRGLVDYVDMIDSALSLLANEEVADDLAERLAFVVVDELQDSSPIQLALFLRLHAIAKRSTWVGDPKQCIFEYAGADPALMDNVLRWAARAGGRLEQQSVNYRSRRCLVDLCNAVFGTVFAGHGMRPEDVMVAAHRAPESEPALRSLPAVGLFYLDTTSQSDHAAALAAGIERLLASPLSTPVLDRETGQVRPLQIGDIAVLVATNAEGKEIARALAALGLRATFARDGLLGTPEGVAVAAALRVLLDPSDSLAVAELEALQEWDGDGPDAWLSRRLAGLGGTNPSKDVAPWQRRLEVLRDSVIMLSPQELIEAVLVALDLPALAARWPDPAQRLANLDALRKLGRIYEQRCIDGGEGCSLSGLLRFFDGLARPQYRQGEERRADEQHSGSDANAVTVVTYHRSKGLEWPVVILSSLDRPPRPGIFDVAPVSSATELNPDAPLEGRWIRYWPWPFGIAKARSTLRDIVEASDVGRAELERESRERARLLYVGFTRARDHLIFAASVKNDVPACGWLAELTHEGAAIVNLPSADAPSPAVVIQGPNPMRVPARLFRLAPAPAATEKLPERRWFRRAPPSERASYWIRPSAALTTDLDGAAPSVVEVRTIHEPLVRETQAEVVWSSVGDALHAFLAADVEGLPDKARIRIATRLIEAYGVGGTYSPASLLSASDAFTAFVRENASGATWAREIPVEARVASPLGERRIDGRIDLLLETEDALIIVDHKSFPGVGDAAWRAKAEALSPQLAVYARAVALARPDKPVFTWIHFATAGAVVVLESLLLGARVSTPDTVASTAASSADASAGSKETRCSS